MHASRIVDVDTPDQEQRHLKRVSDEGGLLFHTTRELCAASQCVVARGRRCEVVNAADGVTGRGAIHTEFVAVAAAARTICMGALSLSV